MRALRRKIWNNLTSYSLWQRRVEVHERSGKATYLMVRRPYLAKVTNGRDVGVNEGENKSPDEQPMWWPSLSGGCQSPRKTLSMFQLDLVVVLQPTLDYVATFLRVKSAKMRFFLLWSGSQFDPSVERRLATRKMLRHANDIFRANRFSKMKCHVGAQKRDKIIHRAASCFHSYYGSEQCASKSGSGSLSFSWVPFWHQKYSLKKRVSIWRRRWWGKSRARGCF